MLAAADALKLQAQETSERAPREAAGDGSDGTSRQQKQARPLRGAKAVAGGRAPDDRGLRAHVQRSVHMRRIGSARVDPVASRIAAARKASPAAHRTSRVLLPHD